MPTHNRSLREAVVYGLRWGSISGVVYATVVGMVLVARDSSNISGLGEFLAGLVWVWTSGWLLGAIAGAAIGVVAGASIYLLLSKIIPSMDRHLGIVGAGVCGLIWLMLHLLLGNTILNTALMDAYSDEKLWQYVVMVGIPGVVLLLAGAALTPRFYRERTRLAK